MASDIGRPSAADIAVAVEALRGATRDFDRLAGRIERDLHLKAEIESRAAALARVVEWLEGGDA